MFTKYADIVTIGFDLTDRSSFERTKSLIDDVREHCKDNIPIIFVGAKSDLSGNRKVSSDEAQKRFETAAEHMQYIEVSAKTGENVNKVFEEAIRMWCSFGSQPPELNDNKGEDEDAGNEDDPRKCSIN